MPEIELSSVINKRKKKVQESSEESSITRLLNTEISLFSYKLSDKKKEAFFHELALLLEAGIDIKTALELILDSTSNKKDKGIFNAIKESVIRGNTLSEALASKKVFSDYELFSIEIGEETGKLVKVLDELAKYYKTRIKQKRQAVSALTYPVIVFSTSMGVTVFMLNVIVPMFADVFSRFGGELPYITQLVMDASDLFGTYFFPTFLVIGSVVAFLYMNRNKAWFKKSSSRVILKVPVLGELVRKIYLARFCNTLHLLISAKIPLLRSLNLVRQMISFYPLETALVHVEGKILHGAPLHEALQEFPVFHKRMVSLIKVGEEVNRLEEFFGRISLQYEEDIEHQSKVLTTVIEPLMMIFLGFIVGIILVAMYLPMFKMNSFF
ncbi:type II secretion system F family protein [Cytophagaceae bacterium ABcell3]|nr:type II secretion system F family protein [Cytophagaceae bacterium ABcell3]